MRYPLRYTAYDWIKSQAKPPTDADLLEALNKGGSKCSPDEMNKVLMQLEILGLITVRWVGKEKRRLEVAQPKPQNSRMPVISE